MYKRTWIISITIELKITIPEYRTAIRTPLLSAAGDRLGVNGCSALQPQAVAHVHIIYKAILTRLLVRIACARRQYTHEMYRSTDKATMLVLAPATVKDALESMTCLNTWQDVEVVFN